MWFQYIAIVSQNALISNIDGNAILLTRASSSLPLSFSMGLWICQSAVNKADLIPAIASQTALNILGPTEIWIHPEESATPAALSNNFFSHPPIRLGWVEVLVF